MITLIGTTTFDLDGYTRLKTLFNYLKPTAILFEATGNDLMNALNFFTQPLNTFENAQELQQKHSTNPETTLEFLMSENYIHKAATQYFLNKKENVQLVSWEAHKKFKYDEKRENNKLIQKLHKEVEELKLSTQLEYLQTKFPINIESTPQYQKENKMIEQKIREHACEKSNIVYVGKLEQIYGSYFPNAYDRLIDLNPRRMKLNEVDDIEYFPDINLTMIDKNKLLKTDIYTSN